MNPQIPNPAAPPGTDAPAPPGVRLPAWPSRYRPDRRGWLLLAGLLLLVLSHPRLWNPHSDGLYFAPLGVGLALIAWLGSFAAIFVAVVLLAVRLVTPDPSTPAVILWLEPLLSAGTLALGWWCYRRRAHGARQLDDPRSATVFLILIPGAFVSLLAVALALLHLALRPGTVDLPALAAGLWLQRRPGRARPGAAAARGRHALAGALRPGRGRL